MNFQQLIGSFNLALPLIIFYQLNPAFLMSPVGMVVASIRVPMSVYAGL